MMRKYGEREREREREGERERERERERISRLSLFSCCTLGPILLIEL